MLRKFKKKKEKKNKTITQHKQTEENKKSINNEIEKWPKSTKSKVSSLKRSSKLTTHQFKPWGGVRKAQMIRLGMKRGTLLLILHRKRE